MPGIYDAQELKSRPFKYRPPTLRPGVVRFAKTLSLTMLWKMVRVNEVDIDAATLERLRKVAGQRVVLTPNHPSWEPLVMFHLSRVLGQEFNYLTAKEVFLTALPGLRSWLLQSIGAYSIVRGTPDRDAMRTTRALLANGQRWLVVFPEGEVCWQNDVLLPFQQGVAQMAFWALDDLAKNAGADHLPPLYFVPIAVKYLYKKDMQGEVMASLDRLERQLALKGKSANGAPGGPLYARLHRCGEAVLALNEARYGVKAAPEASLDQRIAAVRDKMLSRIVAALGVKHDCAQPLRDRVRSLFNAIDQVYYAEIEDSAYAERISKAREEEAEALNKDLWRVLNFVGVQGDYVASHPSAERFLDTLGRLEQEVFKKHRVWGPRKAVLRAGEPLNLSKHYADYLRDKRGTLAWVTETLEARVKLMLGELVQLSQPLETPVLEAASAV